jgi:hypothetical protein
MGLMIDDSKGLTVGHSVLYSMFFMCFSFIPLSSLSSLLWSNCFPQANLYRSPLIITIYFTLIDNFPNKAFIACSAESLSVNVIKAQ